MEDREVDPNGDAEQAGRPSSASSSYREMLRRAELYAADPSAHIVLLGETGTGKTTLARHMHSWSPRAAKRFVALNLAAEAESLALSSIVGHKRGAFTNAIADRPGAFERADGGTVFLDEIGKSTKDIQKALLQVVDTGELTRLGDNVVHRVDCRVIVASNISLDDEVAAGRFHGDLLARFGFFRLTLPPLRERPEDIPPLAMSFLESQWKRRRLSPKPPRIHADLMRGLVSATWPGNIRDLRSAMHVLYVLADGASEITPALCDRELAFLRVGARQLSSYSREELEALLQRYRSVTRVAGAIGFSRTYVHMRLRELGIRVAERTNDVRRADDLSA